MLSIIRAIRSLDEPEAPSGDLPEFSVDLVHDDRQYPVVVDLDVTGKYLRSLDAILARMTESPMDATSPEIRSLIRGAKRDHKLESEKFLTQLRSNLDETVESLNEMILSLASGKEDYHVRADLRRLEGVAKTDDIQIIRSGIQEAVATIEKSLDELKRQNDLKVAELSAEIRVLHQRINVLSGDNKTGGGAGDVRAAVEAAIAAGGAFSLMFVVFRNLVAIRASHGADIAARVVKAAVQRLTNQMPPEAVIGAWAEGVIAACATGGAGNTPEQVELVNAKLSGKYVFPLDARQREIVLTVRIGTVDATASETPAQIEKRIGEMLRQLVS